MAGQYGLSGVAQALSPSSMGFTRRVCHTHRTRRNRSTYALMTLYCPKTSILRHPKGLLRLNNFAAPATTPLHTALCTSAPLHNIETPKDSDSNAPIIEDEAPPTLLSPTLILEQLKTREEALDALKKDNPAVHKPYLKFVDRNFTAMPHQRNAFLTEAVPFLYRAVAPALIMPLVEFFYIVHRSIFKDPMAQHMKEAKALLKGVSETYLRHSPSRRTKVASGTN